MASVTFMIVGFLCHGRDISRPYKAYGDTKTVVPYSNSAIDR